MEKRLLSATRYSLRSGGTVTDWKSINPPKNYTDEELLYKGRQALAMRRVKQAKDNGTLVPATQCEVCDTIGPTVAHHWKGYSYPFQVWWVCRYCNANLHNHDGSWSIEYARRFILEKKTDLLSIFLAQLNGKYRECDVCGSYFKSFTGTVGFRENVFLCAYCSRDVFHPE